MSLNDTFINSIVLISCIFFAVFLGPCCQPLSLLSNGQNFRNAVHVEVICAAVLFLETKSLSFKQATHV